MRMVSVGPSRIKVVCMILSVAAGANNRSEKIVSSTEAEISNTSFPPGNTTLPDFEPPRTVPAKPIVLCGSQPPKTEAKLSCEYLHRETPNIARCPYSFPATILSNIETFDSTYDVRKLKISISIDVTWPGSAVKTSEQTKVMPSNHSSEKNPITIAPSRRGANETVTLANVSEHHINEPPRTDPQCGLVNGPWMPQLFFSLSQTTQNHELMFFDVGKNITENKGVFHLRTRLTSTVWCKTSLWQYPFDTHLCVLYIGVFQAQNYSVKPFWDSSMSLVHDHDHIHAHGNIFQQIPGFDVFMHVHRGSLTNYVSLGNREVYSLPMVINIRRQRWKHVVHAYMPSCLMVILGWASFYIPDELAEGRVLLTFLNVVGTIHMFHSIERVPTAGTLKAIDVWFLSIVFFIWVSVMACILDLDYAFRSIEREQQEAAPDLVFFYQQPKLARSMADTGRQEELERQGATGREYSLIARLRRRRETLIRGRLGSGDADAGNPQDWRKSRFDRRRLSTSVGSDLFFDAVTEVDQMAVGSRVEWTEFYQWAHERHASRHAIDESEEEPEMEGSLLSVQSLLENMWSIRKEYRWFNWSDYVSKCVEIMYPVFFCMFVVVYCLVYVPENMEDIPE